MAGTIQKRLSLSLSLFVGPQRMTNLPFIHRKSTAYHSGMFGIHSSIRGDQCEQRPGLQGFWPTSGSLSLHRVYPPHILLQFLLGPGFSPHSGTGLL